MSFCSPKSSRSGFLRYMGECFILMGMSCFHIGDLFSRQEPARHQLYRVQLNGKALASRLIMRWVHIGFNCRVSGPWQDAAWNSSSVTPGEKAA